MNRLARESSPYLLQHAANPVDWWPWCDEAFDEAVRRGVPVFLSIGYSTCYWCHVMERESFENAEIAAILNARYVAIKVDREERPEIDDLYMAATVIMTGHGGWPMSVFIDPGSRRPFWCGTYFPPSSSEAVRDRPSFPQVLLALSAAYSDQRSEVLSQGEEVARAVAAQLSAASPRAAIGGGTVSDAVSMLVRMFDRNHGGFSGAPKFPQPTLVLLLLDVRAASTEETTLRAIDLMLRTTLDGMMIGGLFDQVAGGFHRYTVDAHWTVPHFEKMLYDNALLVSVYARAARALAEPLYERTARRTLAWMEREMMTADGLFAAALDAEVDGREGSSVVWQADEALRAAGDLGELATALYGLDRGPNFRDPHHPEEPAAWVLRLASRPDAIAAGLGIATDVLLERWNVLNDRLFAVRAARAQPRRDDKAIAAWNGMVLVAMADAAESLDDAAIAGRAGVVAQRIAEEFVDADGGVVRSVVSSRRGPSGTLEDYGWISLGLMRVAGVLPPGELRDRLMRMGDAVRAQIMKRFGDAATGGLFDVEEGRTDLFVRPCSTHDGATPCGTSVAIHAMCEPGGNGAIETLAAISGAVAASPVGCANSVRALLRIMLQQGSGADLFSAEGAGGSDRSPLSRASSATVVQVLCAEERIVIGAAEPVAFTLRIVVQEGWHLAAAQAEQDAAFRVGLVGGTGIAVYADYPEGETGLPGTADGDRAYRGTFDVPVVLERSDEWTGTPLLGVTFQACNDSVCLAPARVELDIALDRG